MNKQGKCPVVQGQDYEVSITDLGIHGEGIGKVNGFTVFVPGALPGERAEDVYKRQGWCNPCRLQE